VTYVFTSGRSSLPALFETPPVARRGPDGRGFDVIKTYVRIGLGVASCRSADDPVADAPGRLGVVLSGRDRSSKLAPTVEFDLIVADFPTTRARLYAGRLASPNAAYGRTARRGYVRRDSNLLSSRCGFNSFELPESNWRRPRGAFHTFSAAHQPANTRTPLPLQFRR